MWRGLPPSKLRAWTHEGEGFEQSCLGAKKTLGLAILGRRVRIGEVQQDAMGRQEGRRGGVNELGAIIRLNALERQAKLCMNVLDEGSNLLVHLKLMLHGKRPTEVAEIIGNDKII